MIPIIYPFPWKIKSKKHNEKIKNLSMTSKKNIDNYAPIQKVFNYFITLLDKNT